MPEVRVVITDRCILPFEEESLPPYQFHVPVHCLVQYGLRCADGPDSLEEPVFPCKAEFGQFPVIGLGQEEGVLPLPYRWKHVQPFKIFLLRDFLEGGTQCLPVKAHPLFHLAG